MSDFLAAQGGVVRVADRDVLVRPLSVLGETALYEDLERLARKQLGPEGRFALVAPAVEHYLAAGKTALARMIVAEAAAAELGGARLDYDAVTFRTARTPEGAALELFHRTRDTHPERTLAEYRAIVTEHNAHQVHADVRAALAGKPETPSPT